MTKSELIELLADFDDNSEIWIAAKDSPRSDIGEVIDVSIGPKQFLTDGSHYPVAIIWIQN